MLNPPDTNTVVANATTTRFVTWDHLPPQLRVYWECD